MRRTIGLLFWGCLAWGCGGTGQGKVEEENEGTTADEIAEYNCRPHTLEEACGDGGCPASPDEVVLECGSEFTSSERQTTVCGGTVVSVGGGFTGKRWVFDADDELVGLVTWTDVAVPCSSGGDSSSVTYGTFCEVEGEAEDLCEANDGCTGKVLACVADQSCPNTPETVATAHCAAGTTVVSLATLCGGVRVYVAGPQTVSYCFDAEGALIGRKNVAEGLNEGLDCVGQSPAIDLCETAP